MWENRHSSRGGRWGASLERHGAHCLTCVPAFAHCREIQRRIFPAVAFKKNRSPLPVQADLMKAFVILVLAAALAGCVVVLARPAYYRPAVVVY
jgi:hypothetical protein